MQRSIFFILMSVILFIPLILIGIACWDDRIETEILLPPRPHPATIQLTAEDVGVTDVMLKIGIAQDRYPRTFTLKRDTTIVLTTTLTSQDTVIIDKGRMWGLLPKHTYRYTLIRPLDNIRETRSRREEIKSIFVTTMDTTSQNFMWSTYTLGRLGSSLNDVAIINDTCIWVVGEIYSTDSLGNPDNKPYGAAIWNGQKWHLMKVPYHDYGSTNAWPGSINTVCAFGLNDVYVTSAANLLHWDGNHWEEKAFFMTEVPFTGQVRKIFGTSGSSLFCVGRGGAIYFVNERQWQKLESGTTFPIQDIWGSTNIKTGKLEILAVASDARDRKILKISGTTVTQSPDSGLSPSISGVWFVPGIKYYVVGNDIYTKRNPEDSSLWSDYGTWYSPYYKTAVRGNGLNDVVIVCAYGDVLHFNGYSWKNYSRETNLGYGVYHSVAMKGNMIVAVGINYNRDVVAIGRR